MKTMRKLFDSKILWMVLSFLISLSVWVYVTSVENVESTKTFRIPVEIVGEETLQSMFNLVITDVDTNMVTVEISGPRRVVNSLDDSMLTAQVDVSRITQAAYTSLNYEIIYPSGTETRNLSIVSRSRDRVNFMVSKLNTKTVEIRGNGYNFQIAEGYTAVQSILFEPNTIQVSGPDVYLQKIDHAYVAPLGDGGTISSTYSEPVKFILRDADNNPVDTTEISYSPETVRATLTVYEMKSVTLDVNKIWDASATEENVRVSIEPASLVLYGDSADMAGLNQIVLDTVDFSKFGTLYTKSYTISIPNGLTNTSGYTEATVTIEVLGVQTKTYQVAPEQVTWLGIDDNTEVELVSGSIPVMLRGPERVIRLLNAKNIRCEVDLSEYQGYRGSILVPVRVQVIGFSNVSAVSEDGLPEYTVLINLKDKSADHTETEETP